MKYEDITGTLTKMLKEELKVVNTHQNSNDLNLRSKEKKRVSSWMEEIANNVHISDELASLLYGRDIDQYI